LRPIIIGIGGAYSGAGKTTYASLLLKRLKGWGAIKFTKTPLYSSIIDDLKILSEEGKDTKRLLDSGAEKVLWVRSPTTELEEIFSMALDRLYDLKGILIEGNSAIEFLKPDIVVFISGEKERFKRSAGNILRMADVVIFDKKPPEGIPKDAKKFSRDNIKEFIKFIAKLISTKKTD